VANIYEPEWLEREDAPLRGRTSRIAASAGFKQLGATLYEIDPGQNGSPFHLHHANEEMIIVLSGRPTLRTLEGCRILEPGEVVAFQSVELAHTNCRIEQRRRSVRWSSAR
jgi:uncharacterized cupin superfamily protein